MTAPVPHRSDWATIPNAVTLLRLVLLVPVCVLLVDGGPDTLAVLLLLVWASTDWVDGLLARALHQTSRIGAILDPIADRIGVIGIVISLAVAGLLPWAALVLIVLADAVMAALASSAALGGRLHVSWLGKIRTALIMASVLLLAAAAAWAPGAVPAVQVMLWIGVGLHLVTAADYVIRARRVRAAAAGEGPPSRR